MIPFQPFQGPAPLSLCGGDPRRRWEALMSSLGKGCRGLSAASLCPSLGPPFRPGISDGDSESSPSPKYVHVLTHTSTCTQKAACLPCLRCSFWVPRASC